MGIFVKILIRAPLDALWKHTQDPAVHERWDLRFTTIRYLPRASENEPQRFEYLTRIGFGMEISGVGESIGTRDLQNGERASSLKFSSDHPLSLIREGSGYWKYIPCAEGVWFLTWYDYRTRFGLPGKIFDRLVFRPLMAWATAWSFGSLRLWLERGEPPASTRILALTHALARGTLALVFAWHGLVPKLLARDPDELAMLRDSGVPAAGAASLLVGIGIAELLFALVLIIFRRKPWPVWLVLMLMPLVTLGVAIGSPRYLSAAFNPITLNLGVAALASIDLFTLRRTPSASQCEWSSSRSAS